jgi:hypothetical protein
MMLSMGLALAAADGAATRIATVLHFLALTRNSAQAVLLQCLTVRQCAK